MAIYSFIIVMWMLKGVSWVSGLVFWASGLVFGVSGLLFWVSTHHLVVYVLAAGIFVFLENEAPGFLEYVYCQTSRCSSIVGPPCIFFKTWAIGPHGYASKMRIGFLF